MAMEILMRIFFTAFIPNGAVTGDIFYGHLNSDRNLGRQIKYVWLQKYMMNVFGGRTMQTLKVIMFM